MSRLAGPSVPSDVSAAPAASALTVAEAPSRWKPAAVVGIAFAGSVALNVADVPGVLSSHWVPLLLLAGAFTAAMQWKREGLRSGLRSRAAAKVAQYGGGVYGAMAMATLLQLEVADLVGDVAAVGSIPAFVASIDVRWLVAQLVESVGFAVRAGLWPWHWLGFYGFVAAGVAVGLDAVLRSVSERYRELREPARTPAEVPVVT